MNWLLGKNRYNPLIRPAANRTERVPVKLQVSLAQLISVVRSQNTSVRHEICAEVRVGVGGGGGWIEKGEAKFGAEVTSKEKLLSCDRPQVQIEASGRWIKRGHKAAFFPPLIYGGDDALPQTSAAPKNYGLASITENRSSGPIPHLSPFNSDK